MSRGPRHQWRVQVEPFEFNSFRSTNKIVVASQKNAPKKVSDGVRMSHVLYKLTVYISIFSPPSRIFLEFAEPLHYVALVLHGRMALP